MLDSLIEKYKEQMELRKKQILYIEGTEIDFLTDDLILTYGEILKDLEQLKEKIINSSKILSNKTPLTLFVEEIIGIDK